MLHLLWVMQIILKLQVNIITCDKGEGIQGGILYYINGYNYSNKSSLICLDVKH